MSTTVPGQPTEGAHVSRRRLTQGAAWAAPVVAIGALATKVSASAMPSGATDGQFVISQDCGTIVHDGTPYATMAVHINWDSGYGYTATMSFCNGNFPSPAWCPTGGAYWVVNAPRYWPTTSTTLNSPTCTCVTYWFPTCYGTPSIANSSTGWSTSPTRDASRDKTINGTPYSAWSHCQNTAAASWAHTKGWGCPTVVKDCAGNDYSSAGLWVGGVGSGHTNIGVTFSFGYPALASACGLPATQAPNRCACNGTYTGSLTSGTGSGAAFPVYLERKVCMPSGTYTDTGVQYPNCTIPAGTAGDRQTNFI